MKKIVSIILLAIICACNKQNKNNLNKTEMIEKFDFEVEKKFIENDYRPYSIPNGNTVYMISSPVKEGKNKDTGFQYERLPKPSFYTLYKEFHSNGNLKSVEKCLGTYVKVGISKYYDEEGTLTKEVDEDKKFGKIKPDDVLKFLDQKGYINLETGEGNKEQDKYNRPTFELHYGNELGKYNYSITLVDALYNDNPDFSGGEPRDRMDKYYSMDGETGFVQDNYVLSPEEAEKLNNQLSPEELIIKKEENILITIIVVIAIVLISIIVYFKYLRK
jgi:hypothetical protein